MKHSTIMSSVSCGRLRTSSPWQTKAPAVVRRGLMSIAVFCCSQGLWYKLDGDDHGDLPSSRERSIREQAVDRNNSGQDISHLVDGDGRRTVREERNRLRLQDDGAVEFNCVYHRMGGRSFKDVKVCPVGRRNIRPVNTGSQSGSLRRTADSTAKCTIGKCGEL